MQAVQIALALVMLVVKKQVGAWEELEAESSSVEVEPLGWSLFDYTWMFALVID